MSSKAVDVLIVGGGPAGLSAALCLSRARYTTAVFDSGVYRNASSRHVHMLPTWDHADPQEYRAAARKELSARYDTVQFIDLAVISVTKDTAGSFYAIDASGMAWSGKKLILATGVSDVFPDIPGYEECWVKGIYHCLFCHGYEDRDAKSVGVLAVDLMAQMPQITNGLARNALQFSDHVTVYTNGSDSVATSIESMVAKKGIEIDSRPIKRLIKERTAADITIEFEDGSSVTHAFLVHGPRNEMHLDFAKTLNLERAPSGGELKVNPPFNETTEPGCFAVGDIGSVGKIVIAGVAFGTFAATGIVVRGQLRSNMNKITIQRHTWRFESRYQHGRNASAGSCIIRPKFFIPMLFSGFIMESLLDFPWLSSTLGKALIAAAVFLLIVRTLVLPFNHFNRNKIIRMEKSPLLTWLQWDTAPRLALDRYIAQGYSQVIKLLGKPFVITMCGMETTVLPEKYLPLLKREDREKLSLCQGFENVGDAFPSARGSILIREQMFNMTATTGKVGRHDHVETDIVAKYINPRLAQFLSHQVSQADYAFQLNLGHADDWKKFNTFDLSSSLVYHLTAVVLVGEELCRNGDYIHATTEYSKSFLMSGFMWPVRPWGPFRDWGYWLGTWSLRRDINRAFKFLLPLIDRRIELLSSGDTEEKPMDMVQGLVESEVPSPEEGTSLRHAHRVLHLTFAASAVSSALILHTLHQMLMTPEYLEPLRKEISKALDEHGGWNENAMLNMPFLDSYLREMLRLYPPSVLTGQRTILGDGFRFDDQLFLPAGSRIAFPTLQIHTDPNNYPDPLHFNPYRFMGKKTAGGGGESSSPFRIDNQYLSFGYGKQACPGRFLAVRQVKLILAKMIDGYDIRWAGKTPKEVKYSVVEGQIFPDLTTQVCLKKRYAF